MAGKDVKNAISTCAAWLAIISLGVPARGILNFDATQFMLDGFGQGPLQVWVCRSDEVATEITLERRESKVPSKQKQAQPRNSPDSAIFIKWYAMIHSGGVSGPMVLVVADKRMTAIFFCMRLPEKLPREPPTTQVQPKLVKKKRKRSDQDLSHMPDDGTCYDEVVGKNGRLRKVRRF